ncbi:alpha/beta-hydrolase [Microthyrium microscopicum]|uniref:Alpha/beta-hydrolase n=1 Tax=Microthyrium microscopicum TaxID=703497 RepID=A0A6A6U574_9PEZI|nr:alpha/beta-hydrolase [Microthyrium microscopicum]
MNPWAQRQALYANNFHTSWWDDLDDPEAWGFGKNQVTPFYIDTPDGYSLHVWHILPRALYTIYETQLLAETVGPKNEFKKTLAYSLLKDSPDSKLVINFHGNAGHLLQHQRPYVYRSFSSLDPSTHVMAFSYRGFGRSTGLPSEPGLITDSISVVDYALRELGIEPSKMALCGQSLGTASLSGVAEYFSSSGPMSVELPFATETRRKVDFATIVLVSGFSDLKTMLLKYSIGGMFPILAPLAWIPGLQAILTGSVHEPWESKTRIAKVIAEAVQDIEDNKLSRHLNIQLIHALDDPDIPYENSQQIFDISREACYSASKAVDQARPDLIENGLLQEQLTWGNPVGLSLIKRFVRKGGHNEVAASSVVAGALMRGLGIIE